MTHPETRKLLKQAREGARKLLTQCLPLRRGDVLALFYDGTTRRVAQMLREAANELDLTLRERYLPVRRQVALRDHLETEDLAALSDALAIITCLSAGSRSTPYRRELLKEGPNFNNYFGHMPGATLELLTQAVNLDLDNAERRCDDLTLALALATRALICTYELDRAGNPIKEYKLHLKFSDERLPITSTGVIPRGTWGNIPGGEVFVAPAEDCANGTFVLNGAFLHFVMPAGSYLKLIFEDGALVRTEGQGRALAAFNRLTDWARQRGGPHHNHLAELGIGVNTGIKKLTGSPLLDEKCAGTAHIAIGDNKRYGGNHESNVHEDFITRDPSLDLDDNKPVLRHGANAFVPEDWRESLLTPPDPNGPPRLDAYLVRDGCLHAEKANGDGLRVSHVVASGRLCRYTVGDPQSSRILAALYSMMPIRASELCQRATRELGISATEARRGLEILHRHRLIREQHRD